ncbi:hypothetical protein A2716_03170 [candidate division WWE3 bacterium RIFCSPHIGHO2_01_FULL_40_23]|uniref:Uncharacterized protein n=1 Tax=candidate division WWE3 bacterium RIFCSPLOWO2_01_FULL_41_18 TaxID=1802625 RepID=A0A1F4VCF5_UNCKA|nr:MAG: hypothetical protein A2716_03170 [candidate division WWE3 bacterium RIFCSPHIGHO2_01_FULL_40_23]OGC54885.1 MAG: hypothetical protein A3A78_02780 [candidate division WWE3 bacterium RIFCSPLOWO2_01_FULL_41_18]
MKTVNSFLTLASNVGFWLLLTALVGTVGTLFAYAGGIFLGLYEGTANLILKWVLILTCIPLTGLLASIFIDALSRMVDEKVFSTGILIIFIAVAISLFLTVYDARNASINLDDRWVWLVPISNIVLGISSAFGAEKLHLIIYL